MSVIYIVFSKRRGYVVSDVLKFGIFVYIVKVFIFVIEIFGFEIDLCYYI